MTFYKSRNDGKTSEIPAVHRRYLTQCRDNNEGTKREEVRVMYADDGVPSITYEQAHGQKEIKED